MLGNPVLPRDQDNFHVKQKNISVVLPSYPINIRVNLSRGLIIFGHTNRDEYSDLVNVFKKNQLKSSDEKRYKYHDPVLNFDFIGADECREYFGCFRGSSK